jgi:hypothetical protein
VPVAGRKPLPTGQAANRAKPAHDWVEVENIPYSGPKPSLWAKRARSLPFGGIETIRPHLMTRKWWTVLTRMPHCVKKKVESDIAAEVTHINDYRTL